MQSAGAQMLTKRPNLLFSPLKNLTRAPSREDEENGTQSETKNNFLKK